MVDSLIKGNRAAGEGHVSVVLPTVEVTGGNPDLSGSLPRIMQKLPDNVGTAKILI